MLKKFNSLIEFQKEFSTELKCIKYLIKLRWQDKVICPHCNNSNKIWKLKSPALFECGVCNKQFSVKVGTIFEDSKLPLQKWFLAFYLEFNHNKGISSIQLSKDLNITQKTAWFMQQRIRYALTYNTIEKMKGEIEIDETYIGGKEINKHENKKMSFSQGGRHKMAVLGFINRGASVVLEYVNKRNLKNIKPILEEHIDFNNSILYTDESTLYQRYERQVVVHGKGEYVQGRVYTNTIEGVFSHFKRYINGTHHQVSSKHIQKYINSFSFRYNNRNNTKQYLFNSALEMMFGKKLEYKTLIS